MEDDDEDSLEQRQENEFQVLQAVFIEDIRDLRSQDAWKVYRPPEFIVTLLPQQSAGGNREVFVQIDLHIKCSSHYPNQVPEISLKNAKGLSTQHTTELKAELETLAKQLCGEVMILELAQHVQRYLHQHNTPRFKSFYEEMLSNRKKKEEEQAKVIQRQHEIIRKKEEKERKAIEEEILRRQEAIREEARLRKEHMKLQLTSQASSLSTADIGAYHMPLSPQRRDSPPVLDSAAYNGFGLVGRGTGGRRNRFNSKSESSSSQDSHICEHTGTTVVQFSNRGERSIQRGQCLGHSLRGSIVYTGMDISSGELVTITEWTLKWRHVGRKAGSVAQETYQKEAANCLKQLATVEQELTSLSKLQHKNLVHYLGMKYYQEKDKIVVMVLQEFVSGGNLSYHLSENIPADYDLLQYYIMGILEALAYLHKNSVVHKDLRDTSVFIENRGLVRVADFSLDKRLSELYCSVNNETLEEPFPPSVGRGGKKADIFRLGILCLSLAKGEIVNTMFPEIPSTLPVIVIDFLERCLTRQEQERWSAEQLLEHAFMKPSISREPSPGKDLTQETQQQDVENDDHQQEIPFLGPFDPSDQSRLHNEFYVLKWLGRGGFGDVFKVRNKLDGGVYAIKRIHLNPSNKQLNRKLTREVKLLSRLNHENVVRYFNSWLETACIEFTNETDSDATSSVQSCHKETLEQTAYNIQPITESRLVPSKHTGDGSIEWSIAFECNSGNPEADEISSEEEEDVFGTSFFLNLHHADNSESIVFGDGETAEDCATSNNKVMVEDSSTLETERNPRSRIVQCMYIQMEFCDRSTLRTAIDNGLYQDENRVWRLFREIIEGLSHIHQQGMIHRDLKPVNIFLDSHDNVKIGDFGLATTTVISRGDGHMVTDGCRTGMAVTEPDTSHSEGIGDGNLTGWVGTILYISPEVAHSTSRASYNEKVDIYSLGIIFFEMCFHPIATAMERVKILDNMRRPEIIFPPEFNESEKPQMAAIIRWLLDHDPTKRPTSQELLQSSYLPPPQLEEAELQEMLRHTVSNPQSKAYKHMISSLFQQEISRAANVTYDMDTHKGSFSCKTALTHKFVTDNLVKVFQKHGAIKVSTPILIPNLNLYTKRDLCVNLIDHNGGVVSLPFDLRVPFCRFIVRNNVTNLRRYWLSPVFRERKVYGCHPRILYECAFDIVTPSPGSLVSDAEVLVVIWEAFSEFQLLKDRHYLIRLNHTSLLKGILLYCGIPEEKHHEVYTIFNDARVENLSKCQVHIRLIDLNLSEQAATTLYSFIEMEGPISKMPNVVKSIIKRKGQAASLIKQGIHELESVISAAEALGLKASIVVATNLVYSIQHFSGVIFQFACELKKKRKQGLEVLAAGGRYDKLITITKSMMDVTGNQEVNQSVVGVSIAVEKLVSALLELEDFQPPGAFDVLLCSIGNRSMWKETSALLRELWNAGISAQMQYDSIQSVEELQELRKESFISYLVILKDTESGSVRVKYWDKDRLMERKIQTSELVEFLLQKGLVNKMEIAETNYQGAAKFEFGRLERSLSDNIPISSSNQFIITFITLEKLAPNVKRRYEGQIMSHLNQVLQQFSPKICVDIIAVELNSQVLKTISTHLEMDGTEISFQASIAAVIEKHQRHRKYLSRLCDQICHLKFEKKYENYTKSLVGHLPMTSQIYPSAVLP